MSVMVEFFSNRGIDSLEKWYDHSERNKFYYSCSTESSNDFLLSINSKRFIHFLLLVITTQFCFGQEWEFEEFGNAFDGFTRTAAVNGYDDNPSSSFLFIANDTDSLFLRRSISNGSFVPKIILHVELEDLEGVTKILMSFDKDRRVYELNFVGSPVGDAMVFHFIHALFNNSNGCLNNMDIINLLKTKSEIHLRLQGNNKYYDYSFPLTGSSKSINKVFTSDYKRTGEWTDFAIDYFLFVEVLSQSDSGELNLGFAAARALDYISNHYGEYHYVKCSSSHTEKKDSVNFLILKNRFEEDIVQIPYDSLFLNMLHFSGKVKRYEEGVCKKDTATLDIYYRNFSKLNLIQEMSLDEFYVLNKEQLKNLYAEIKENIDLIDWLRSDKKIYYYYDRNDYTLEVFSEAWGMQ